MKSNKGLYILLPVVFIVWGIIIYRLVQYVGQGNAPLPNPAFTEANFETEKLQEDTFSISANYRDPFGQGNALSIRLAHHSPQRSETISKSDLKEAIPIPTILYNGTIKNKKSNKEIALIKINGKRKMLSAGDMANEVKLLRITRDSILVSFYNAKMSIYISHRGNN